MKLSAVVIIAAAAVASALPTKEAVPSLQTITITNPLVARGDQVGAPYIVGDDMIPIQAEPSLQITGGCVTMNAPAKGAAIYPGYRCQFYRDAGCTSPMDNGRSFDGMGSDTVIVFGEWFSSSTCWAP